MYNFGNGSKRRANDTNVTDDMDMDGDGGVHGRKYASKRARMMTDLMIVHGKVGAKSTTPVEPSTGNDSVSSHLTNHFENGSGQSKKLRSNQLMKSHGNSSGGERNHI